MRACVEGVHCACTHVNETKFPIFALSNISCCPAESCGTRSSPVPGTVFTAGTVTSGNEFRVSAKAAWNLARFVLGIAELVVDTGGQTRGLLSDPAVMPVPEAATPPDRSSFSLIAGTTFNQKRTPSACLTGRRLARRRGPLKSPTFSAARGGPLGVGQGQV